MRKVGAVCWILLLVIPTLRAQQHSPATSGSAGNKGVGQWVKFSPEAGQFSILLPQGVEEKTESGTTDSVQSVPYTSHLLVAETAKGIFIVGWVDYDPSFAFGIQSELEANRNNFVKGVKGTLLTTTQITINGNPGIEFTAENPKTVYQSRIYIIGRRPYQLIAGTYKGQDDSDNVTRFFESFEVR